MDFITAAQARLYIPVPADYNEPFLVLTNPQGIHLINSAPWFEAIGESCSAADACLTQPWVPIDWPVPTISVPTLPPTLPHVPAVPESSTYALLVAGMFAAAFYRRLRRA